MWWNDWKFQLHWNMLEWVDPKTTTKRVKPFSVSSKKFYINNNDITAHFVGHSKLTQLDIVYFYKRKQTNENMETEKGLTLLVVVFGSTHSSMFQCNWNFRSFHHLLD